MNTSLRTQCLLSAFLVLSVACGAPDATDPLEEFEQSLASDPWENIYAVRKSGSGFVFNPIGDVNIVCPDGVTRTECTLSRFNLARSTNFSVARQQDILNRAALEPSEEARVSLLVKGQFVTVRDHRTNPSQSYVEFRASAVYWAPSVRTHAAALAYVATGIQSNGFQVQRSLNPSFYPRGISIPMHVRFRWIGSGTAPSSYPEDSFVAEAAFRPVSPPPNGGTGVGPFEMDVDQRFLRVTN